jgi:iron complex transport system substrate-binding protein
MVAWLSCSASLQHLQRVVAALAFAIVTMATAAAQVTKPQRIVSLNLCLDQILVDLVPRERIAAISHLGADPAVSAVPERLVGLPSTRGEAEDVLALNPDLILASTFTRPATVSLLRSLGKRVEILPLPQSLAGIRTQLTTLGQLVGEPDHAQSLISVLDRTLDGSPPRHQLRRALIYQVNSMVSGPGGLMDEVLAIAGYQNAARELGASSSAHVTLETLIETPPDLLIVTAGPDDYRTPVADNLRHPLLKRLPPSTRVAELPWRDMLCGTHHTARLIERLRTLERRP